MFVSVQVRLLTCSCLYRSAAVLEKVHSGNVEPKPLTWGDEVSDRIANGTANFYTMYVTEQVRPLSALFCSLLRMLFMYVTEQVRPLPPPLPLLLLDLRFEPGQACFLDLWFEPGAPSFVSVLSPSCSCSSCTSPSRAHLLGDGPSFTSVASFIVLCFEPGPCSS